MFKSLHPESAMMVYQHLPNDKRVHSEATRKKLNQAQLVCCGAMTCAYREDDLAFVFIAKSAQLFKSVEDFLLMYHEKSKEKYKEIVQLHIGIGTPIAERPSHTTGHTDHVSGDSAGQNRHK